MRSASTLAAVCSQRLHLAVADEAAGQVLMMVDPVLGGMPADASLPVPLHDARIDPAHQPRLVPLDTNRLAGSTALTEGIAYALRELGLDAEADVSAPTPGDAVRPAVGRRIGPWLAGHWKPDALARHLGQTMLQTLPDGTRVWLRLHDAGVLWALWPVLTPTQQAALLGPISVAWLLDPGGDWITLRASGCATCSASAPLQLSQTQWHDVAAFAALQRALRSVPFVRGAALDGARETGMAALRRARALGFTDEQDSAAFAVRALTVHPRFDGHPAIRERLAARGEGDYFTGLVDDVDPAGWARVAREASRQSLPAHA